MDPQRQQFGPLADKYAKTYVPRTQVARNVSLQARDYQVFYCLAIDRLLTSTQILELLGLSGTSTAKKYLMRLRVFYDAGYLCRVHRPAFVKGGGKKPIVYALANKAAEALANAPEPYRLPDAMIDNLIKVDWAAKNKISAKDFVSHTLLRSEIKMGLRCACASHEGYRFVEQYEFLDRCATNEHYSTEKDKAEPQGWTVNTVYKGKLARQRLVPDDVVAIERRQDGLWQPLCLEADRGTEPNLSNENRAHIYKKHGLYRETARQRLFEKHFGLKSFLVLYVTTHPGRTDNMIKANKAAIEGNGWKRLWFTSLPAIRHVLDQPNAGYFDVPWVNGRDEQPVTLAQLLGIYQ